MPSLILASQSPRRKQILERLGYSFEIQPSLFDERSIPEDLDPHEYVSRVSLGKAEFISGSPEKIILASDLTVWSHDRLMHKPATVNEARQTLPLIWNDWHDEVGACVVGSKNLGWKTRVDVAKLWLPALTPQQLEEYLTIADPTDKAGGIDIRCFVHVAGRDSIKIQGDATTIIGLNAFSASEMLGELGLPATVQAQTVEDDILQDIMTA